MLSKKFLRSHEFQSKITNYIKSRQSQLEQLLKKKPLKPPSKQLSKKNPRSPPHLGLNLNLWKEKQRKKQPLSRLKVNPKKSIRLFSGSYRQLVRFQSLLFFYIAVFQNQRNGNLGLILTSVDLRRRSLVLL